MFRVKNVLTLLIFSATAAMGLPAHAGSAADEVVINHAYVRATPPGAQASAAFMVLENSGEVDHALVAASSGLGKKVEFHNHIMEEGMMKMRQVMKIELPAGMRVTLEPGGLHVMFMGLNQRPEMGDTVALTLTFADGSQTTITIPVKMIKGMKKHG